MNLLSSEHDHEEHGHEELVYTTEVHEHGEGLSGLWEVMFGFEHVVAEFFWNAVLILATILFTKAIALRKIHKYVDDRHGVKHKKEEY